MHDHPQPNRDEQTNDPQRTAGREKLRTRAKRAWIGITFSDDLYGLIERASQIYQTITSSH
ncbi:hypothetical protein [Rhodococcus sp. 1139]|uniref:hypothetical protein n=1 Tax=Rhodococcus sp. 1139 TaxID=1833762 RepID=UPI000872D4AF|nr:hypothetical protein [Rhodococcus sp. 1139]OFE10589.1 hypothetical protein A5N83_01860 [Rhodococcus sp. 1139]